MKNKQTNKNYHTYFNDYRNSHYKAFHFYLDIEKDKILIEYLNSVKRKTTLIKSLLYQYMENHPLNETDTLGTEQTEDGRE